MNLRLQLNLHIQIQLQAQPQLLFPSFTFAFLAFLSALGFAAREPAEGLAYFVGCAASREGVLVRWEGGGGEERG